jgi:hypothetical protein
MRTHSTEDGPMILTLIHWLRRRAGLIVGRRLAGAPPEPTAEDDRGAGI